MALSNSLTKHRTNIQGYFFLLLVILPVFKHASWILLVYFIEPSQSFYKIVFCSCKGIIVSSGRYVINTRSNAFQALYSFEIFSRKFSSFRFLFTTRNCQLFYGSCFQTVLTQPIFRQFMCQRQEPGLLMQSVKRSMHIQCRDSENLNCSL